MSRPVDMARPIDIRKMDSKYKCIECGCEFDEPIKEERGEFWGMPCDETLAGCPHCRGEFLTMEEYYETDEEEEEDDETD